MLIPLVLSTNAAANNNAVLKSEQNNKANSQRIISLSPHLTEWVFALNKQKNLIAVSDYSDFPKQAAQYPSVASYQGANIAEIIRLAPSHILVWRGGNKDADIEKLKSLGFAVYESNIDSLDSFIKDIEQLGVFLGAQARANMIVNRLNVKLEALKNTYKGQQVSAVYYMNTHPLIGLGNDTWLNELLSVCGISNIYSNSASAYPQLKLSDIIRKQPNVIIAANKSEPTELHNFWSPHHKVLNSHLIRANPDALHRFTIRAIDELNQVCVNAYKY
jgi:vitamin B12 transport system substrate-binding protein